MCSLACRHSRCHQAVTTVVDETAWIVKPARFAPAVNRLQKSSRRVGYLRATVRVSNFYKVLLHHDFENWVARESLRREFGKGSLSDGSELPLPTGSRKTPGARVPGVFRFFVRVQRIRNVARPAGPLSVLRSESPNAAGLYSADRFHVANFRTF